MNFKLKALAAAALTLATIQPGFSYMKSGLIDQTGRTIIPCEYASIQSLGHGRFFIEDFDKTHPLRRTNAGRIVDRNGHAVNYKLPEGAVLSQVFIPDCKIFLFKTAKGVGLCRNDGKVLVEPGPYKIHSADNRYFYVYSDPGLPPVADSKVLFTLDSATGKSLPPPQNTRNITYWHGEICPFSQIRDGEQLYGYMSKNGEVLIPAQFGTYGLFSKEGFAAVASEFSGPMYYIDKTGKQVSPRTYDEALEFHDGYAVVCEGKDEKRRYGLIDTKFNTVIPFKYTGLDHMYGQTYGAVDGWEGKSQFITASGKPDISERARNFHKPKTPDKEFKFGFAVELVDKRKNHRRWQLVDRRGRVLISQQPAILQVVSADRIIKIEPTIHFNKTVWDDPGPAGSTPGHVRLDEFGNLLADYNLIGMSREKLTDLIGRPKSESSDTSKYSLDYDIQVDFEFKDGTVQRWREFNHRNLPLVGKWNSTDVVYSPDQDPRWQGRKPYMELVEKGSVK